MPSRPTHKIDATGETLGRLAVRVSVLLRGKNKPDYAPHIENGDQVVVFNTSKIKTTGRKMESKTYYHHTGYLGNLKSKTLADISMSEALYSAVRGMLPNNKLRAVWLKRLKTYENEPTVNAKAVTKDQNGNK